MTRIGPICLAAAGLAVVGATGTQAQSPCGDSYEIRPGDTLYSVAQQCRVTLRVGLIREVPPPGDGDGPARMTLEGRVARGVECHTMKTPEGEIWSLVSSDVEFTPGEYVEVTGTEAGMSFCMQGRGTIEVSSIEEVQPPR